MDIMKTPLVVLFEKQNPYRIISNYFNKVSKVVTSHNNIDKKVFLDLHQLEEKNYSKDDTENIYYIIDELLSEKKSRLGCEKSVFNLLSKYSSEILENNGDAVRCNFKNLLKWRAISLKLDQDLFICSFLAHQDILMSYDRNLFDWDIIIKSNNIRLHNILAKGMAENHFHLKGSAPIFKLNWISLMNDISCRKKVKIKEVERLEKDNDGEVDMPDAIFVAALLRVILFKIINGVDNFEDQIKILKSVITKDKTNSSEISINSNEIKSEISILKSLFGADINHKNNRVKVDYAIKSNYKLIDKSTRLFVGERAFMYDCLKKIYSRDQIFNDYIDLFYSYLIIKNKIRAEIIQENGKFGFSNFSTYQDRKTQYLKKGSIFMDYVEPLAILTSIKNQNLVSVEARVMPGKSSEMNIKGVNSTDNRICNSIYNDEKNYWMRNNENKIPQIVRSKDLSNIEKQLLLSDKELLQIEKINKEIKDKYFYVFHFPKVRDIEEKNSKNEFMLTYRCRHYSHRKEIKKQSIALVKTREKSKLAADRILGIDACSNEIVTRPEVFGQAFRFLKGHLPISDYQRIFFGEESLPKLRATYHVGEDFLDIVDGLRAIDEAIEFLNLTHGDRLGHAIALAIDVREWYSKKHNRVYLTKHEILDNISWLIGKIKLFNIVAGPDTIDKLMSIYHKYYVEIYTDNDEEEYYFDNIAKGSEEVSRREVVPVDVYIEAWKLRGDNPEAYFKESNDSSNIGYWNRCAIRNKRTSKLVRELYKRYHYDADVKYKGYKREVFKIKPYMIDAIVQVQKCMQNYVKVKGIGIEANPSSNVLISNFCRYDKHPVLNMYNRGLECNESKEIKNPELFVSINTDDQGVFDTLLENEYALMAIALGKMKNSNGDKVYNEAAIYEWINRVREMGIEQSFRVRHKNL